MNRDEDRDLSFEEIHKKYVEKIYALIFWWVDNTNEANDLTQGTFVNAYRTWSRFRGDVPVYNWLYDIALDTCNTCYREREQQGENK